MEIKKYTKQDGSTRYKFQAYLGTDESTGKRIRVTRQGFKTRKAAQLAYARLKLKADEGAILTSSKLRFEDVYNMWLEQYKNTVKASTLNKTMTLFKAHILPVYAHMMIDKIKPVHCQKAVNAWYGYYKNYKILNSYTGSVFDFAIRQGIVQNNPTKLITMPVKKEKPEEEKQNYYNKEELEQFFKYLEADGNLKWLTFFRVLAFTGRGEALALRWCDINHSNSTITVSRTLTLGIGNKIVVQTPKTKTSKRVIKIDAKTLAMLKQWRSEQNIILGGFGHNSLSSEQLLFTTTDNAFIPLAHAGRVIDRICKKHGIKRITTHGFRHTHCSLLFEAGATIKEVQDRLGHADIKTTMNIYAHVTKKGKEKTAELFAQYVNF